MSFVSIVKSAVGTLLPKDTDDYVPIRPVPQKKTRFGFGRVITNGVDSAFGVVLAPVGAGMTVAQAAGNLTVASGVNANQDTLVRSNFVVTDPYTLRWSTVLSQRIANQRFVVELVDIIGDALPATILTATTIRVTLPAGKIAELGWDTRNYGQTVSLGNYSGTGTFVPLNAEAATITTISGNDVTFTVAAGGLAAGSGTISVFGWNYHRFTYDGTTATAMRYQSQRNGWPGTAHTPTINTTASPGHVALLNVEDNIASYADMLRAASTSILATVRGSSVQDMPPNDVQLYLQLRVLNGTAAPASTTTWTVAFVDIDNYAPQQVSLTSVRPQSYQGAIPAILMGGSTTAAIQATASSGTTAYFVQSTAQPNGVTGTNNTTGVVVKTTAGQVYEISVTNNQASTIWVKLYNKATAPTVGTDLPLIMIPVAAGATVNMDFGQWGKRFNLGIGIGITANGTVSDTTAPAAGAMVSMTYS